MDDRILKVFADEIEKTAIVGSLLVGGMYALSFKDELKEMKHKTALDPLTKDTAMKYKLKSPYSYQFEGGKGTGLSETRTPHTF